MKILQPAFISSRLCAAVGIGGVTISIEYSKRPGDKGRTRYRYHIDDGASSHSGHDLQSGCQGGTLQEGLVSLLSFLAAGGEAYGYELRSGSRFSENTDLFPAWVNEWAYQYDDELSMLQYEMEEGDTVLIDEG